MFWFILSLVMQTDAPRMIMFKLLGIMVWFAFIKRGHASPALGASVRAFVIIRANQFPFSHVEQPTCYRVCTILNQVDSRVCSRIVELAGGHHVILFVQSSKGEYEFADRSCGMNASGLYHRRKFGYRASLTWKINLPRLTIAPRHVQFSYNISKQIT